MPSNVETFVCVLCHVSCAVSCAVLLQEFVTQASGQLVGLYAELIGAVLPNISHPNRDIQVRQHYTPLNTLHLWSALTKACYTYVLPLILRFGYKGRFFTFCCFPPRPSPPPYTHNTHSTHATINQPTNTQAVAKEANAALLNLQPSSELPVKVEVAPVLAIISRELRSEQEPTHLEALRW